MVSHYSMMVNMPNVLYVLNIRIFIDNLVSMFAYAAYKANNMIIALLDEVVRLP